MYLNYSPPQITLFRFPDRILQFLKKTKETPNFSGCKIGFIIHCVSERFLWKTRDIMTYITAIAFPCHSILMAIKADRGLTKCCQCLSSEPIMMNASGLKCFINVTLWGLFSWLNVLNLVEYLLTLMMGMGTHAV